MRAPFLLLLLMILTGSVFAQCDYSHYMLNGNLLDDNGPRDGVSNDLPVYTTDQNGDPLEAMVFDGVNDCIRLPKAIRKVRRTVNVWAKVESAPPSGSFKAIINSDNPTLLHGNTIINVTSGPSGPVARFQVGGTVATRYDEPIQLDTWYMLTIVRDGVLTRYYVDGALRYSVTSETNSSADGQEQTLVGCGRLINNWFDGDISEVLILDCVLSDAQVAGLYETPALKLSPEQLEEISAPAWDAYPNPAREYIRFEATSGIAEGSLAEVYSLRGELMTSTLVRGSFVGLVTTDFPDGIYLARFTDVNGKVTSTKFSVQR